MVDPGLVAGPLHENTAVYTAIVIFTALAWYNVLELSFLIFNSFKRYGGLYFWSLLVCAWGTALHALGFILKFFPCGANIYLTVTIITVGWYCMVTGQAVVLYSRIHIVVRNHTVLKVVLWMIIVDAILFHIPTTVLTYGSNSRPPNVHNQFLRPFEIMEKIQMTAFSTQEIIISGIYVQATLRLYEPLYRQGMSKPMIQLILVNIIVIAMNFALLGIEYGGRYDIEATMKSLVYSIKLKLEFAVLRELKGYTTAVKQWSASQGAHTFATGPVDHIKKDIETTRLESVATNGQRPHLYGASSAEDFALTDVPGPANADMIMRTVSVDLSSDHDASEHPLPASRSSGETTSPYYGI